MSLLVVIVISNNQKEASGGAGTWWRWHSVAVKLTGCETDPRFHLYFHFFGLVSRHRAALSSATQHAMPPELGGKWGAECLNTRFPLSVKLI